MYFACRSRLSLSGWKAGRAHGASVFDRKHKNQRHAALFKCAVFASQHLRFGWVSADGEWPLKPPPSNARRVFILIRLIYINFGSMLLDLKVDCRLSSGDKNSGETQKKRWIWLLYKIEVHGALLHLHRNFSAGAEHFHCRLSSSWLCCIVCRRLAFSLARDAINAKITGLLTESFVFMRSPVNAVRCMRVCLCCVCLGGEIEYCVCRETRPMYIFKCALSLYMRRRRRVVAPPA